ncbi:cytochrome b-c1 complex subunit 9 [Orussus abietinus]|uniref:cytochrome b-c1 complex subunit 9 n=1 Tax=Orussus abietinus TaxID=222816 RepID=UPI0006257B35|nr:cytochrome b-c1 complex subunit 9 [Orussus abietinus]
MAGISSTVYNALFKRTSTFALTILVGSFFFERAFDLVSTSIFESVNKGKLWKDIKHKYEK